MVTPLQVKAMAKDACMFVNDGVWLRMQYCDDGTFTAANEDTGEDYVFGYDEVDMTKCEFHKLAKMEVPTD